MMDFNQLKQLAEKLGGVLVLEGDQPKLVIMSYEQFKKGGVELEKSESKKPSIYEKSEDEESKYERLNNEILALREEIKRKEEAELTSVDNIDLEVMEEDLEEAPVASADVAENEELF